MVKLEYLDQNFLDATLLNKKYRKKILFGSEFKLWMEISSVFGVL